MRTDRRRLVSQLTPAVMILFASTAAHAQAASPGELSLGGLAIDGYYSYYRLETVGNGRLGMGGAGARLMWRADSESELPWLLRRTAAGLFADYAPGDSRGFSVTHTGIQGDLRLLSAPLFGRIEPVISVGAGVLQTSVSNSSEARSTLFPLAEQKTATFALSPAFGTRLNVWRQFGIRVDLRDVVTFRDRTLHNMQFAGGASFVF